MKVSNISFNPAITYRKNPNFYGSNLGLNRVKNIFSPFKNGLSKIEDIKAGVKGGTTCKNSLPLKNFWKNTDTFQREKLENTGMSTNTVGYARCFLKAKADVPISTSFVHDCTVMYLYNSNTETHCLYHAEAEAQKSILEYIAETLMPEGFTSGAIIPGCSLWISSHVGNMLNMFDVMKSKNPKAVVNVYHSCSTAPEIVGYKGLMYEIPNIEILFQRRMKSEYVRDYGQASFNIVDIQSYNTISRILHNCNTLQECDAEKEYFRKNTSYPKEIKECFYNAINKRRTFIEKINNANSLETLDAVVKTLPEFGYFMNAVRIKLQQLLIKEFGKISTKEEFLSAYDKASNYSNFSEMKKLKSIIAKLENKFFS